MKQLLRNILFITMVFTGYHHACAQETVPGIKMEYGYDLNGNRITKTKVEVEVMGKYSAKEDKKNKKVQSLDSSISITIGPNPTKSIINIEQHALQQTVNSLPLAYSLFNSAGVLITENKATGVITTIDLTNLNDGVYILKVIHNNKTTIFKIIKTN
ncbi:MAG: T9SS type A sorting domain-containing protein [Bacteroidota bacterium]